MKRLYIYLLGTLLLLVAFSCVDEPFQRFGFDSPFEKHSDGLVLMYVGSTTKSIYLEGSISIETGDLEVGFLNPENEIVYSANITNKGTINIDEIITPSSGIWKLKYQSKNGTGTIDLHAFF